MSGGGQNTVTQNTLPPQIAPYLTNALSAGQNLWQGGGPQYYPGQQVAGLNPTQLAGVGSIQNAALGPNASQGAQAANEFETSGALLNPSMNPYLQGTFQQGANAIQNQLGSEFAANGSNVLNSLPVQSDEMNNLATQLYGGAYQQGLQNMTMATQFAPSIDAGTYQPGQQLLNVGSGLQSQTQNEINAAMQKYNYTADLPYNMLSWYSGLTSQNAQPFGGQSSSGTMTNNPFQTALGLGMAGLGAYGLLGGGAAAAGTGAGLMSDLGIAAEAAALA